LTPTPRQTKPEPEHHQAAFERYYALGEKRSFARLAREVEVSVASLKAWSRKYGWQDRVRERDATVARQVADQSIQSLMDETSRNKRIVQMALVRLARAIANGQIRMQMGDLDRLIRLQSFLDGYQEGKTWESLQPEELAQRFDWLLVNMPLGDLKRFRAEAARLEQIRNGRLKGPRELSPPPRATSAPGGAETLPAPGIPE